MQRKVVSGEFCSQIDVDVIHYLTTPFLLSLKESLYIQTCALMASFICKLRKRLRTSDQDKEYLASLNLIIGRLCNLLIMQLEDSKHRKNPFSILLDSDSVSTLAASTTLGMDYSKLYLLPFRHVLILWFFR